VSCFWIFSPPIIRALSKNIVSDLYHVENWIRGFGLVMIVGSQIVCGLLFYLYQRRERKVHALFKDLVSAYATNGPLAVEKKEHWTFFPMKERKYSENNELKLLLGSLEEGAFILDAQGNVLQINQKAMQILQIFASEAKGKSFQELIKAHPSFLGERVLALIAKARNQGQEVRKHEERGGDDKRFYELIAIPTQNEKKIIFLIQDHSSDHKMLTMGKNFVTNASHELRTPITIIEGFTETLQEMPNISEEMFQEIITKILNNCHRMASVVKSLLVLADLDYSGKATLQPCDLVGLVESCSYTLLSAHPEVKVETLFNEKESIVWGDPDLLELAIINLFENSVKYSKGPAFITVTVETLPDLVNLSIKDSGIGIAPHDIEHIFERFYTVNKSHSRKLGGAGLGLSIVKLIMEKHDAKISAASPDRKGTIFTMQFQKTLSKE
jgi:signal transduction histidine kinase